MNQKRCEKTINISVQDDLDGYIRERADKGYFGSVSEYIRWLVAPTQNGLFLTAEMPSLGEGRAAIDERACDRSTTCRHKMKE